MSARDMVATRVCRRCKEIKSALDFYERSACCKPCAGIEVREYRATPEGKVKLSALRRRAHENSPRYSLYRSLTNALNRKPTNDPVTLDELMQMWESRGGLCELSGMIMTWAKNEPLPTSISIDRKDYKEGYTKDNVRLVCHAFNSFRMRMTDAEMLSMAETLVVYARTKTGVGKP